MFRTTRMFFLAGWLAGAAGLAAEPLRVAVMVSAPEQADDWQAALTAALGSRRDVQVVERTDFSRILEERVNAANAGTNPIRSINGIEFYLNFRRIDSTRWFIEKVAAASGAVTGSVSVAGATFDHADAMASAAEELLKTKPPDSQREGSCVAVIETGGPDARAFILAARLRDSLRSTGLRTLDRALTQTLVVEKGDAERGWRGDSPEAAFLGADFFVEVAPQDSECEVRVVAVRDGRLIGSRRFAFDGPGVINAIQPWLLPLLGRPAEGLPPYLPSVEVEALEPFYRGLALFNEGEFAKATAEFTRAYLLNDKFRDAMLWEARCYERLELVPLAAAMRRFAEIGLVGNGPSATGRLSPAEAVAFLGVSGEPAALASSLSALSASALAALPDREIRLPEHLARLRREFDWLAGVSNTEGARWEQSGSFFCRMVLRGMLRQDNGGTVIDWTLNDTITGEPLSRRREVLAKNPADWPQQTAKLLKELLSADPVPVAEENDTAVKTPADVAKLASQLSNWRGIEANTALINLALADPGNLLIGARGFEKGQSKRDGLDAFLNFALRDWVIARLPDTSPRRRWLELMHILSFSETEPVGRLVTGHRKDVADALEKFAAQNPTDPPGLAARYSVFYARQSQMPPDVLWKKCDELIRDLRRADTRDLSGFDWLENITRSVRDFAAIAAGDVSRDFPQADRRGLPHRIRVNIREDGHFEIASHSDWITNEFDWVTLSPADKINEARAALAINGRPGEIRKVKDRWLTDFPRSIVLASYVSSAIHEMNFWYGKPLMHALNWDAERAAFLQMVDYVGDTAEFWIKREEDSKKLDQLENLVWSFLMNLNERVYLGIYSDQQYEKLRDRLAAAMDETNRKLGRQGWAWKQEKFLPWREITRKQSRELRKDHLGSIGQEVFDREVLLRQIKAAEDAMLAGGGCDPLRWWQRLRGGDIDSAFTAPELARLYQKHSPRIIQEFKARKSTSKELGFLFEQALAMFEGGLVRDAEELFLLVFNCPKDGETCLEKTGVLRANAAFRLAQIHRLDGRKAEAIEMARQGLQICGTTSWFVIGRLYDARMEKEVESKQVTGNLASHLTRLLVEMRVDFTNSPLPAGVGFVTVPTPNADNPLLKVFYRTPPKESGGKASGPKRVLLLLPSLNHDVLEYLQSGNSWSRFADAHDFVLVCPQFYTSDGASRAEHAFTYYSSPQIWSGKALLGALDKISRKVPIQKDHLLFHSYGAGAGFACHFSRWRPDLVAAVSSHGGGGNLPWFQEIPGLQPLSAMKNVRFFVSGGQDDDFAVNTQNRVATAEAFVTVLRGAGVDTIWKPFPGVPHIPTPEMEAASQEFLKNQ